MDNQAIGRETTRSKRRTNDCVDKAEHEALGGPVDDEVARHVVLVERDLIFVGELVVHARVAEAGAYTSQT